MQSTDRILDLLEALVHADDDVRLSDLHQQLGLPLSTVHRLLNALVVRGYVVQDLKTQRYGPGAKLLVLAAKVTSTNRFRLQRLAKPYLQQLTERTGETANLVLREGNEIVYIDQVLSPHSVKMFTEAGCRAPLYCTGAGKAILSSFTSQQLEAYLHDVKLERMTPRTITSADMLREELMCTRERGYAIDDEEREEGVRCVGAPIFDHLGTCIGAISISGPAFRMSRVRLHELGPLVRNATSECSVQIGYTPQMAKRA